MVDAFPEPKLVKVERVIPNVKSIVVLHAVTPSIAVRVEEGNKPLMVGFQTEREREDATNVTRVVVSGDVTTEIVRHGMSVTVGLELPDTAVILPKRNLSCQVGWEEYKGITWKTVVCEPERK